MLREEGIFMVFYETVSGRSNPDGRVSRGLNNLKALFVIFFDSEIHGEEDGTTIGA